MKSYTVDQSLECNEYYHGTYNLCALSILFNGFRLNTKFSRWGRNGTFGSGVYLTKSLETACSFGSHIFKCTLANNTRLLKLDGEYDPKIVNYLKKEFGNALLEGDFAKVIPQNKHLTKKELICLMNYRFKNIDTFWKGNRPNKWDSLTPSLRQQLAKHKFDAIGENTDLYGVAVLNPSLVKTKHLYLRDHDRKWKCFLRELDKTNFIQEIRKEIEEAKESIVQSKSSRESVEDYDHFELLLNRYISEYSVSS